MKQGQTAIDKNFRNKGCATDEIISCMKLRYRHSSCEIRILELGNKGGQIGSLRRSTVTRNRQFSMSFDGSMVCDGHHGHPTETKRKVSSFFIRNYSI
uniref:Astacin domain-containing protein n=1 Tax=Steinernema glaseri TaxID=37863 RepID=A0A1I7Z6S6_9BILA